jgi:hypothetical protein
MELPPYATSLMAPTSPSPCSQLCPPLLLSSPSLSSPASQHGRPWSSSSTMTTLPCRTPTKVVFLWWWSKWMHMTSLLLSPALILSEINSSLWILCDFIFQTNSDFISNSNFNLFRLVPPLYINLGAPTPCLPTPISPQNWTLAATWPPPPSPVPLITATSFPKSSCPNKSHVDREKPKSQL